MISAQGEAGMLRVALDAANAQLGALGNQLEEARGRADAAAADAAAARAELEVAHREQQAAA
eukprot:3836299-Prymnesium_polylepis.1